MNKEEWILHRGFLEKHKDAHEIVFQTGGDKLPLAAVYFTPTARSAEFRKAFFAEIIARCSENYWSES